MDDRLTKFFRKPIPENWGMMFEWPVCYLKTRVDCGAFKSNGSRRTSRSVRLDMEKIVKIGGFLELECFVGN